MPTRHLRPTSPQSTRLLLTQFKRRSELDNYYLCFYLLTTENEYPVWNSWILAMLKSRYAFASTVKLFFYKLQCFLIITFQNRVTSLKTYLLGSSDTDSQISLDPSSLVEHARVYGLADRSVHTIKHGFSNRKERKFVMIEFRTLLAIILKSRILQFFVKGRLSDKMINMLRRIKKALQKVLFADCKTANKPVIW